MTTRCRLSDVPKLWSDTIETHRRAIHDAVVDATASLVDKHGLSAVTMSQVADAAGIGRATLYKYFPDLEAILRAWHERHVLGHLAHLQQVRDHGGSPSERLGNVLTAYAHMASAHPATELAALLHRGKHVEEAQRQLKGFVRDLIAEGATAGDFRVDVSADELASYCLHALTAAASLPSKASIRRLVTVTLAGLRRQS